MNENKNSNPNFDFYSFNLPQTEETPTIKQPDAEDGVVETSVDINETAETSAAEETAVESADATQEMGEEAPLTDGEVLVEAESIPYDYTPERRRMKSTYNHLGWGVAIITIAWIAISTALYVVAKLFAPDLSENGIVSTLMGTLPLYVICMPLLFLIIRSRPKAVIEKKKLGFGHFMLLFFMAQALMMAGSMVGNNIMDILSNLTGIDFYNQLNDTMDLPLWFSALLTVVLAPVFEELIFRKLLLDRMLPHGEFAAIFVNGLCSVPSTAICISSSTPPCWVCCCPSCTPKRARSTTAF
ncbi:MAG: CPBP family intramembrane metalloprotease [Clostridia bacterium]|nr:CPBP family intramembrane metalloprotease [Clostridia bacterium]